MRSAIVAALETLAIKDATAGSVVFITGTVEVNKFHKYWSVRPSARPSVRPTDRQTDREPDREPDRDYDNYRDVSVIIHWITCYASDSLARGIITCMKT